MSGIFHGQNGGSAYALGPHNSMRMAWLGPIMDKGTLAQSMDRNRIFVTCQFGVDFDLCLATTFGGQFSHNHVATDIGGVDGKFRGGLSKPS